MAGIYIHIPFCKQACHYCNFHFSTNLKNKDKLINAILKEIELKQEKWKDYSFETIYFGGGTPSILPPSDIEKILNKLYKFFKINPVEVTLEANPDDLSIDKTKTYKTFGINRLSIGIQSFFDVDLQKLNRSHDAQQAETAIKISQNHGIENLTIDLIYGIPGLSDERWIKNITKALEFKIPHISAYALTVEQKTALAHFIKTKKFPEVSDEQAARQFDILRKKLIDTNFLHYEVSNFGKEKFLSQHNTSYWKNIPYMGLGPSAHSYKAGERQWNIANNYLYIKKIENNDRFFEKEILSKKDIYNETIMTGLRTMWGVDLRKIENIQPDFKKDLLQEAAQYIKQGKLLLENNFLKSAPDNLFLIEGIISDLFKV